MLSWVFALISAEISAAQIGDPTLISNRHVKVVINFIIVIPINLSEWAFYFFTHTITAEHRIVIPASESIVAPHHINCLIKLTTSDEPKDWLV
tara:strand:- start:780 stop:1058 length:279 start_codon:yes stop_codon:yes gene_type:complete